MPKKKKHQSIVPSKKAVWKDKKIFFFMSEAARMLLGGNLPAQQPPAPHPPRPERPERPRKPERPERQPRQKTQINNPLHTVFFYNIPYNVSNEEFRNFALQYGEIMNLHPNLSKGQAFATYYDIRNAEKAVHDVQDKEFNGRRISSNFAFRPPNLGKKDQPTSANVLVKPVNYLAAITEQDVSDALKSFGEIRTINKKEENSFLVKFFNIKDAKACAAQTRVVKTVSGEPLDLTIPQEEEPPANPNPSNNKNNFKQPPPPQYGPPQFGAPPYPAPQYGAPPPQFGQFPYQPPPYGFPPPQYGMPPPQYGMPPPPPGQNGTNQPPPPPPPQGAQQPIPPPSAPQMPPQYGAPPIPPAAPPVSTSGYTPYSTYGAPPQPPIGSIPGSTMPKSDPATKSPNFDYLSKLVQKSF